MTSWKASSGRSFGGSNYHFGDISRSLVSGVSTMFSSKSQTKKWTERGAAVFEALHGELRAPFNADHRESAALLRTMWTTLFPDEGDFQPESLLWKSIG
jgi:hypothetical protein